MNKSFWAGAAVVVTAIVLIAVLVTLFSPVPAVLANTLSANGLFQGPPWAQGWHGGGWGNGAGFSLPPELQGLTALPADQRFSHLVSVQVNLKDQNNQPLTINVIAGKVTEASATGLTIAANNGTTQSFTLNDKTMIHNMAGAASAPAGTPQPATALPQDSSVVVVTVNGSATATAVLTGGPAGFAWPGPGGWTWPGGKGH